MADPVRITIPAEVAAFVRPGTSREERLRWAEGDVALPARQKILLLFCLSKDSDDQVCRLAIKTMALLDDESFAVLADWSDAHPALLHAVALCSGNRSSVRKMLLTHQALADVTRTMLDEQPLENTSEQPAETVKAEDTTDDLLCDIPSDDSEQLAEQEPEQEDEEGEEFQSKYQQAQNMGISEKIKMALTGDKEWRKMLVKDSNKLVSSGVLKNPRITESEVLTILKSTVQNEEIIRLICANKEWIKNLQIRKALVENSKTPLAHALRYLGTMSEKDIAGYAKSRNISSVLSTQAKRMLLAKKK